MPFLHHEIVVPDRLERSSCPHYDGNSDSSQRMDAAAVQWLKGRSVVGVISANHVALSKAERARLDAARIAYHHFPVGDFQPHTAQQLRDAAAIIGAGPTGPKFLIYCGYGHGRTGTLVTAWQILRNGQAYSRALADTNHVETDQQRAVLAQL